jgi:DNA polymerase-1
MTDTFSIDNVTWVLTDEDLNHLLVAIDMATEVVLDLETTGLYEYATQPYPARIVLASFTLPTHQGEPTTWLIPLSHPDSPWSGKWRRTLRAIALAITDAALPIIGHNVKFDLRWIRAHAGVNLADLITWDTQVSSHLLDENRSTRLKDIAPATFPGLDRWDDFDLTRAGAAEHTPMFDLGAYAARDTYWTWRLSVLHRDQLTVLDDPQTAHEIEHARLGKLARWCAMPTTATLSSIEQRGIRLDPDWAHQTAETNHNRLTELTTTLAERYPTEGEPVFTPTAHWFRTWAQHAVDAGDLVIAELTPTGKARWSKGVLTRQARNGSTTAEQLLELRTLQKRNEYLYSWLGYLTPHDTIHTTYHDGSVVTGRLSSSSPNMQQVTAALKPAFVPSDGYVFADLDYSQIELRVAAFISRCQPMLEAFRRGDDLHTLLAAAITGKHPDQVTPDERQKGKSANFGLLYMMSAYGFREYAETVYGVTLTNAEAVQVHNTFFTTWDGIGNWHARAMNRAHQTGQVVSPIGRIRRLPDIHDTNDDRVAYAERGAVNSPVQGFASDLMQIASASIEGTLPDTDPVHDAHIVATVHDSILVEVPEDLWQGTVDECIDRMLNLDDVLKRMDCTLDVPLEVTAKIGTRWGQADLGTIP